MRRMITAMCAAAALTTGLSAAQAPTEKGKGSKSMKDGTVMVTGCVAENGGHYMLNKATASEAMKDESKKDVPMAYELMGGDLQGHVGHQVEVTGTTGSMDKTDKNKMAKDKAATGDMHGMLHVKSVRMISPTCP